MPWMARADSIEKSWGCRSGKCPGCDLYKDMPKGPSYKVPCLSAIPQPRSMGDVSCVVQDLNRNFNEIESRLQALESTRSIWYRGEHLVDPKHPNCCKPLPYYQFSLPQNNAAKNSMIYKRAHGLTYAWLYPSPHDADIGRKPHGAGTRIQWHSIWQTPGRGDKDCFARSSGIDY